ncbi:MAG TPA: P-type conjugative transfer protein TrbL [Bryobacteraceae bacterium]|nr:P-type conjugative transfer protein TrbL [Bryobacteraceae bacterium]
MTTILAVDFGNGGPDLINDVANQYINAINSGFGLIKGDVTWVLNVLIILSIMWSAALWALSDDHVIAHFARKIVYIGFFAWIIQNWQSLTDTLASSFMNLGLKAGGFDGASYYTSQPGNIAYLGYTTAQPLMDQIARLTGPVAFFKNIVEIIFLFLAVAAIVTAFCVITIQVVVAVLTFKFGSLAAFVLVPFAVLSKTAFIAERPLGWVVGSGVRLMVLTLVLGVGNNIFQSLKVPAGQTVTTYQAFCIALAALLLMALSLVASRLATDMIIGGPSLGVGTAINTTAAAINTTTAAGRSRAAVMAVKMAATVPTKGAMLVASAGTAVVRKITGGSSSAGNKTGATAASVVSGSTAPQAGSTTAANTASRVPGSSSPKGTSGPTNTGGTPT